VSDFEQMAAGVVAEPRLDPSGKEPPAPTRPRRRGRRIVWGLAVLAGLVLVYYVVSLYDVWFTGQRNDARPVDAIVVMGAAQYDGRPSPQLASRLDHALDLYRKGYANRIFVTGGKQPLDRFTEAASEARYLEDRGVPDGAILRETQGRDSWQSLTAVASQLKDLGLHSVLLVSDPYHMARIKGMAEELGLEAHVSATPSSPVGGLSAFRHDVEEAAGVGISRVIGYRHFVELFG
jgi:uncharacterized SAM-binding protein YcdF (DUF218 family)